MAKKKVAAEEPSSAADKFGIVLGLTATAVAAAGAYFLYGSKHAEENRKKVKGWMLRAKGDVLERLEEAKEMSKEEYQEVVASVADAYSELKNASRPEIKQFKDEMLEHWNTLEKFAKSKKRAVSKSAETAVKKAAKKAPAKKTAKKAAKKTTKKKTA
jgi:gas vesicle protein